MKTSLTAAALDAVTARLAEANAAFARRYPGERPERQPVHTVYGGAHLFKADTARKLGAVALRTMDEHARTPADLAEAVGLPREGGLAADVHERVRRKLEREPVEDFRIDFEDGYGVRPNAEEDGHAASAAAEVARGLAEGTLPPFVGIRVKPFNEEMRARSVRTLDVFLTALAEKTGGKLPPGFAVTIPKVTLPEQVAALADLFDELEPAIGLATGALHIELMIEMPQAILDRTGRCPLPALVDAARGRCLSAHFGTYDYTAGCSISAAFQHVQHASCDFAKHVLQVSLAGTGVWISDGATNVMPVGDRAGVRAGWRRHYEDVRNSLVNGFYQGWDLHPAQLPTRYAAVYAFFLESLPAASERLRNFIAKAAQATLVGEVFDDAATGQGLLNYFLRGIGCRAITEAEAAAAGLGLEEIRLRSFAKILEARRARA